MDAQNLNIEMKTILTLVAGVSLAGFFISGDAGHNVVHATTAIPFVAFVLRPIGQRLFGPRAPNGAGSEIQ